MPGPSLTVAGVTNGIRNLLSQYPSESVLRELLQNADDAGASKFDLVLMDRGFDSSQVTNPLLTGPSLALINNAKFTKEHRRSITSVAGSSKSHDLTAVGRFGLGQNSVFHLCEAWLFMGRSPDGEIADVMDPWSDRNDGDDEHPTWDEFGAGDKSAIHAAFHDLLVGNEWFILWLPLRSLSHRRERNAYLHDRMPDPHAIGADLSGLDSLSQLLPQLGKMRQIRFHRRDDPYTERSLTTATSSGDAAHLLRPASNTRLASEIFGTITRSHGSALLIRGEQRVSDDDAFTALQRHPLWPKRSADTGGKSGAVDEKVLPHGAVSVIFAETGGGESPKLHFRWCAFLPLAKEEEILVLPAGTRSIYVHLHGYFIVDHGRREIDGLRSQHVPAAITSGGDLIVSWNHRLRERVVLPCLLEALARAVSLLTDEETSAVLAATRDSRLFSTFRDTICAGGSLVLGRLHHGVAWRVVSSSVRLLPVPRRAIGAGGPLAALLGRAERGAEAVLVDADAPNLRSPASGWGWTRHHLRLLLDHPDGVRVEDDLLVGVLVELVEGVVDREIRSSMAELLLRHALRIGGAKVYLRERLASHWRRLAACVVGVVILRTTAAPEAQEHLRTLALECLVLPRQLVDTSIGVVGVADGRTMLRTLAAVIGAGGTGAPEAGRLAAEVVVGMGPRVVADDPVLKDLPVFGVWSAAQDGPSSISASRLSDMKEAGLAFRSRGLFAYKIACRELYTVMVSLDHDVIVADEGVADPLELPDVSLTGLVRPLVASNRLSVSQRGEDRVALLRRVIEQPVFDAIRSAEQTADGITLRQGIRLLLHGDGQHRRAPDDLWVVGSNESGDREAVQLAVEARGETWRLVPDVLAKELNPRWAEAVGVTTLAAEALATLLAPLDVAALERVGAAASNLGRVALLRAARADCDLWRRIPVHVTADGRRVAATRPRAWLRNPSWELPESLLSYVDLIEESRDESDSKAQRTHLDRWCASAQLQLVLESPQPELLYACCLDALDETRDEWPAAVGTTAWLPTVTGSAVRPDSLLELSPSAATLVASLLSGTTQAFAVPAGLLADAASHRVFPSLRDRFALRGAPMVLALAIELDELPATGLALGPAAMHQETVIAALRCKALDEHPGWALVRALYAELPTCTELLAELVPALAKPIGDVPLVGILVALGQEARALGAGSEGPQVRVFCEYLRVESERPEFIATILCKVPLLNDAGDWVAPSTLAQAGDNLAPRYRLAAAVQASLASMDADAVQRTRILREQKVVRRPAASELSGTAEILDAYFDVWMKQGIDPKPIGFLVALLGDESGVSALAERWVFPRAPDVLWDWAIHRATEPRYTAGPGDHVILRRARYAARLQAGGRVDTLSIVGTALAAELASDQAQETIFSDLNDVDVGSEQGIWLSLLPAPPALPAPELYDLLRRSILAFAEQRLRRRFRAEEFDPFWHELTASGQVAVEAARQQILAELPAHLQVLSYKGHPELAAKVQARRRAAQRASAAVDNRTWADDIEKKRVAAAAAHDDLIRYVECESSVHRYLLTRIRRKLDDYQYDVGRVVWELLQNADDAVVQLDEMWASSAGASLPPAVRTLRVEVEGQTLRVIHWGRRINQHILGGFRGGADRGYEMDLLNMMVLNTSEKDPEHGTTGRFGLGFKSVHLITDEPQVGSGALAFAIVGGMLPRICTSPVEPRDHVRHFPPTVFRLPLRPGVESLAVIQGIRQYGGIATVFTRALAAIELSVDGVASGAEWRESPVPGVERAWAGVGCVALGAGTAPWRFLVLREGVDSDTVSMVFGIRDGRFVPLPRGVPSLWCTAPTGECWDLGFAINGPFSLNVGRSEVACGNADTRRVFERAGRLLAEVGLLLYDAVGEGSAGVREALGLPVGGNYIAAVEVFWESLWAVLARPIVGVAGSGATSEAASAQADLLLQLHRGARGLIGLVAGRPLLPTSLPGAWKAMVRLRDVVAIAAHELEHPAVLNQFADWPWMREHLRPGSLISDDQAAILRSLDRSAVVAATPNLVDLLAKWAATPNSTIEAPRAVSLAVVADWINADWMRHPTRIDLSSRWLGTLRFSSSAREARLADEVLVPELPEHVQVQLSQRLDSERMRRLRDEGCRAAFAPSDRVLSADFTDDPAAMTFFLTCRTRLLTGRVEEMDEWARRAIDTAAREAALRYCVSGELRVGLADRLKAIPLLWFPSREELFRNPIMQGWSMPDRVLLQNCLFPKAELDPIVTTPPVPVVPEDRQRRFFDNMLRWWAVEDNRTPVVSKYESDAWPSWIVGPDLADSLERSDDSTWLALLVIGACRSLRWSHPVSHRDFLDMLRNRGWWDIFLSPDGPNDGHEVGSGKRAAWMNVLRVWQDDAVEKLEFQQWMGLFPTIYQLSRFLPVYRRMLRGAGNRQEDLYRVKVLLCPKADEALTQAGENFQAPPAPLNMGLHWVLRELVRLGVARGDHLWADCWVPGQSVIRILRPLGLQVDAMAPNIEKATRISEFMQERVGEAWTMERCFDIPLRHIDKTPLLRQRLGLDP